MVSPLEDEVEGILKELVAAHPQYKYHRNRRVEGRSGYWWETDFILMRHDSLDAIIECKNIGGKEWERKTKYPTPTFETHMCRAYTRLNDLHLKYPEARLYVIVREFLKSLEQHDKYARLFPPIGAELMCLKMVREKPEYYLLERTRGDK